MDCTDSGEAESADPTGDCNDAVSTIYPGATEVVDDGIDQDCNGFDSITCYQDSDQDGYGTTIPVIAADGSCDTIQQESNTANDCNDAASTIYPGATEVVDDGIDQDCNGFDSITCYQDSDKDGYGTTSTIIAPDASCDLSEQEASTSGDCNDADTTINPAATELPDDNVDQNCDGTELCYLDADDDTYRPDASSTTSSSDLDCTDPGEAEGTDPTGDCDDNDPNNYPGNTESCDGQDNDCNGLDDFGNPGVGGQETDNDGDGQSECQGDCNDADATINPVATELPDDGVDQNCDGTELCYLDADDDTYRPAALSTTSSSDLDCVDSGEATGSDPTGDCNDGVASIYPGAPEVPDDGIDQDCSGTDSVTCYVDSDMDGYGTIVATTVIAADGNCDTLEQESYTADDCDDSNSAINPGVTEICNGIDDNCDGNIDEGFADTDFDGTANCVDSDDDNDGVLDGSDTDSLDPFICEDTDTDTCDDCSVGTDGFGSSPDYDPNNDGFDYDGDGQHYHLEVLLLLD